jgi:hypothetical protein
MGGIGSGRHLKYTAQLHKRIVRNLRAGAFLKHAAEETGVISFEALKVWLRRGERSLRGQGEAGDDMFEQLALDVAAARATDAIRNQRAINDVAFGRKLERGTSARWRAAAWNLERKHPLLYGRTATPDDERERERERERPQSPWGRGGAADSGERTYDA